MQRILYGTILAALALSASPVAAAQEPAQMVVSFSDIDLTNDANASQALRRMRHAAEEVCGGRGGLRSNKETVASRACVRETMEHAVADLNHPLVNAQYYGTTQVAQNDVAPQPWWRSVFR